MALSKRQRRWEPGSHPTIPDRVAMSGPDKEDGDGLYRPKTKKEKPTEICLHSNCFIKFDHI